MARPEADKIIEWKERRGRDTAASLVEWEIPKLKRTWEEKEGILSELCDFIPMRLVTYIEVFVRESIKDLIDYGSPFLERSESIAKGAKIDFAVIVGLHGKKLSAGDIVAHSLSINEPSRIIAYFSALIPNFVDKIKNSHELWEEQREEWPLKPIMSDYNLVMERLGRIFIVRHVVTHELPQGRSFELAEIDGFFEAAISFLDAIQWVIVGEISGSVPKTQFSMNRGAVERLDNKTEELEMLAKKIALNPAINGELFEKSQISWKEYAEKLAEFEASAVLGGTMYRLVWAGSLADETVRRIKVLRDWAENEGIEL
ncbi:lysozyme inhibitor LprI family protein [Xanthobacter sp. 126]|uniref:lysozyme inhibitor LprI family protein n=1 Tax=Xanthobacter sp. 126 TaxID=1131814 RepID=UPI0012DEDBCF|nr:lysozyme inhibitor LprI family protein [Xanthobacter sp. 126]